MQQVYSRLKGYNRVGVVPDYNSPDQEEAKVNYALSSADVIQHHLGVVTASYYFKVNRVFLNLD